METVSVLPLRVCSIYAGPAVPEPGDEGDLPFVVERCPEREGTKVRDGRAVERVSDGDDAILLRIDAGEDANEARLRRSQKGDLAACVESRSVTKGAEFAGILCYRCDRSVAAEVETV